MLHTLVGPVDFRRGTDLYFERHDGQAVTCEDFIKAIEDASGRDLGQFRLWYKQAGTPIITAKGSYNRTKRRYTLTLSQQTPATPGQKTKKPMLIPVRLGLVAPNGEDQPLYLEGEDDNAVGRGDTVRVVELTEAQQSFVFNDVTVPPIPSLFRGFSAPIRLEQNLDDEALTLLGSHDADTFNRWEAAQSLAAKLLLEALKQGRNQSDLSHSLPKAIITLFQDNLADQHLDHRYRALLLRLPAENYLSQQVEPVDPGRIHEVREGLRLGLAERFEGEWQRLYDELGLDARPDAVAAEIGRRSLRNTALHYLCGLPDQHGIALASRQYDLADNMTDRIEALTCLVDAGGLEADQALADFFQRWRHDALVIDKWFSVQARSPHPDTLNRVRQLLKHPAFSLKNPNRLRSLIGSFAAGNPVHFHATDGSGYALLTDIVIELNSLNPQTAARLLAPMRQWRRYEPVRRELMAGELQRLMAQPKLSPDVFEVASKSLEG